MRAAAANNGSAAVSDKAKCLEILEKLMSPPDEAEALSQQQAQQERDDSYLFAEQLMAPHLDEGLNPFK